MYNRYIPQPDGSFRRNRINTLEEPVTPTPPVNVQEKPVATPETIGCLKNAPISAGSFLKQLIPKNLDTGDLLVIVLLLLMAADCKEDNNSALLTLALYLFL